MPRIIPFSICPKCDSKALIQHYKLTVAIVYHRGVKLSQVIKRTDPKTSLTCGKCGYKRFFNTPLRYKQVI